MDLVSVTILYGIFHDVLQNLNAALQVTFQQAVPVGLHLEIRFDRFQLVPVITGHLADQFRQIEFVHCYRQIKEILLRCPDDLGNIPFDLVRFGVDAVNMYPLLKWNEIYVSNHATEIVKKCLYEYFEGYGVVKQVCIDREGIVVCSNDQYKITKYGRTVS